MAALTKLESTCYYQGRKSVDDYIDEFSKLVDEARYMDGLVIVMKFRKVSHTGFQDPALAVSDTPPRILMDSIRSPDTPCKLLMES